MNIAVIVVIIILIMLFILLFMYKNNNGINGGLIIDVDPKYSEYANKETQEVAYFYEQEVDPYEYKQWKYDNTFKSFVVWVHNALINKFNDEKKIKSFNLMSIIPCLLRIYIDENSEIDSVKIIGCGSYNDVIEVNGKIYRCYKNKSYKKAQQFGTDKTFHSDKTEGIYNDLASIANGPSKGIVPFELCRRYNSSLSPLVYEKEYPMEPADVVENCESLKDCILKFIRSDILTNHRYFFDFKQANFMTYKNEIYISDMEFDKPPDSRRYKIILTRPISPLFLYKMYTEVPGVMEKGMNSTPDGLKTAFANLNAYCLVSYALGCVLSKYIRDNLDNGITSPLVSYMCPCGHQRKSCAANYNGIEFTSKPSPTLDTASVVSAWLDNGLDNTKESLFDKYVLSTNDNREVFAEILEIYGSRPQALYFILHTGGYIDDGTSNEVCEPEERNVITDSKKIPNKWYRRDMDINEYAKKYTPGNPPARFVPRVIKDFNSSEYGSPSPSSS